MKNWAGAVTAFLAGAAAGWGLAMVPEDWRRRGNCRLDGKGPGGARRGNENRWVLRCERKETERETERREARRRERETERGETRRRETAREWERETEGERTRAAAEQAAFRRLQNYTVEDAYGMGGDDT